MRPKLKSLADQVLVITGASSGIGLTTARMAAARGARLVLFGRSTEALAALAAEIERSGGHAIAVTGDVASADDLAALADRAVEAYGRIDTWVNNAGVSAFGKLGDMPLDDARKLFETNFWGLVLGTREAIARIRTDGGAIINVGSELSDRAIPLQGFYSASKHAVKGYTQALRTEVEADGLPISVTLIKPGPIDTPYTINAKNFLDSEPQHTPPPVYAPETVARAILRAAEHPLREVYVGGAARMIGALSQFAPGLVDKLFEKTVIPGTPSGHAPRRPHDRSGLDAPTESLQTRGNYPGHARETSFYTELATRPGQVAAGLAGTALAIFFARRATPQRRAVFSGRKGSARMPKGLHITLEARRGRADEVVKLLADIRESVAAEPGTAPWFALRRSRRVFEIFESFPDERGRRAHLTGAGAAALLARSRGLLRRPARITRLDVLDAKSSS